MFHALRTSVAQAECRDHAYGLNVLQGHLSSGQSTNHGHRRHVFASFDHGSVTCGEHKSAVRHWGRTLPSRDRLAYIGRSVLPHLLIRSTELTLRLFKRQCCVRARSPPCRAAVGAGNRPLNALQNGSKSLEDAGTPLHKVLPGTKLALMEQTFDLAGEAYRLVVPSDADAVIDHCLAAGVDDPYWCRVWPSALMLAATLTQQPDLVRGKRVLELGCGLGLCGIAAAKAGAAQVVLTDRDPLALRCALRSARRSGLRDVKLRPVQLKDAHLFSSQIVSALLDWEALKQPILPGYDVILGADLMYIKQAAPQLAGVIPKLCTSAHVAASSQTQGQRRGSLLLMADPEIRTPQNRAAFVEAFCDQAGFKVSHDEVVKTTMDGITSEIRFMHFQSSV